MGTIIGPHALGLFGEKRPIAEFLGDLGKLLLMFFAGSRSTSTDFGRAERRSIVEERFRMLIRQIDQSAIVARHRLTDS